MSTEIEMEGGPNIVLDGMPSGYTLAARREMKTALLDYLRGVRAGCRHEQDLRALMERVIEDVEDWDIEPRDVAGFLGGGPLGRLG